MLINIIFAALTLFSLAQEGISTTTNDEKYTPVVIWHGMGMNRILNLFLKRLNLAP